MKLLDIIKRYLHNRGIIVRSPLKRKVCNAKAGQCKIIEPYDFEADLSERMEELAKERELPHKIPEQI